MNNEKQPAYRQPDCETRARMSAQKTGSNNPMYSRNHSEQTKQLISDKVKKAWEKRPDRPLTNSGNK
jgi:hypothetical protein